MQYKISAKVSDSDLTSALVALHKVTPNVLVTPLFKDTQEAEESPVETPAPPTVVIKSVKKKAGAHKPLRRTKRTVKQRTGRYGTDHAIQLIDEYGTQAFKLQDVIHKIERRGFNRHLVYRAARILLKEGRVKKLSQGIYQRTPASMVGDISLAARTIEQFRSVGGNKE